MGNMRFFLSGLLKIFITTFFVASITFFMLHLVPGNPFTGSKSLPPEIIANLEAKYHLNEPTINQYFRYMGNLLKGDLGPSLKYTNRSVNEIIFSSLPISLLLGISALIISIPCGLLFGIVSAFSKMD